MHSIALVFYTWGPEIIYQKMIFSRISFIGCVAKRVLSSVAIVEPCTPANDGNFPGDFGSRAEVSVRVRKGGFMVDTL